MNEGFIKLYRSIMEHPFWNETPFSKGQAWVDLLLRVNHKDKDVLIGNKMIKVGRGSTIWSIKKMSRRWGWSRGKVGKFLDLLESQTMIEQKRDTKMTYLTICNYDTYQGGENEKRHQNDIKMTSKRHQNDTNKNDKNDKNDKNKEGGKKRKRFSPPTLDEVKLYCDEKNLTVDPYRFISFYDSKNWMVGSNKMSNWKSALSGWDRRNKTQMQSSQSNILQSGKGKDYGPSDF